MRHFFISFPVYLLLLTSCDRKHESNHGGAAIEILRKTLDPRISPIYSSALIALVGHEKPCNPFTFASSVDYKTFAVIGIPAHVEREVINITGRQGLYVYPNDVVVTKGNAPETLDDGRRRFVPLISRSRRTSVHAYIVRSIEETSATTVKVNWGVYKAPLDAHGGSVQLVLVNGQWIAEGIKLEWIS
jgi:hypothetical protein